MTREFELRKEVELPASPEQVWAAITTAEGMAAWFMPMDPTEGTTVDVFDGPRRFVVRTPVGEDGSTNAFEYLIEARDGGSCVLRFVHSGFLGDDWSQEFEDTTSAGWDLYLHTLAEYLRHFAGSPATYVMAEGPAGSARPQAWPTLLTALGVPEGAGVGDRLQLGGPEPVQGTIDYLHPQFLGVRTGDALYRFHGRWTLDLPVAVGHHYYGRSLTDAERSGKEWASWLAETLG